MAMIGAGGSAQARVAIARLAALLAVGVLASPAIAWSEPQAGGGGPQQNTKVYFDTSHEADARLRNAENHVKAGDFAEAIEIYQKVIQDFGDKVVEVPPDPAGGPEDSRLSVNARLECQRRIASLPPEVRAIYRSRVDAQAGRWYAQGAADRDPSLLRRVIAEAFCSSWGDDALDLLGDLAFQDGRFAEALAAYDQLAPDRSGGPRTLAYPDPSVDLARVLAKKLLCRAAIGNHPPTEAELAELGKSSPEPSSFAGRKAPLARVVAEAIRDDHLTLPPQADGRWPTFAGSPSRDRVAPAAVDVGSLQWRAELETIIPLRSGGGMGGMRRNQIGLNNAAQVSAERLLGYHPIVVGDQVLVAGERSVTSYNLDVRPGEATPGPGAPTSTVAWRTKDLMGPAATNRAAGGLARYTLTASDQRVFARIGPPPASVITLNRMGMGGFGSASPSLVVGLDRAEGKILWKREAGDIPLPKRKAEGANRTAVFEGSPVAYGPNVYVAMTDRIEMTATYVVCLDAASGGTRWVRYICEASANVDPIFGGGLEISHRLLTLDGPNLYYQTNLGAVASLEADTGSIRWLATYPWPGHNNGGGQERDVNPAVVHDGLVIVAPNDTPSIYAYDAASGRLAWKTAPVPEDVKLTHLLGVAKGYLIATGDRVLWFDVRNGKLAHAWPDTTQPLQGYGRGVLAGDRVYWPTKTEIHVLDQGSGLRTDPPIRLQESYQCEGGNLAVGDGYLIVAQANALVVFCQNSRLIERYRDEIARAPEQASTYFLLARAAEAVGRDDLALESLDSAIARSRPADSMDGVPLGESSRDHQLRLLMKLGGKARLGQNWAEASKRFEAAAAAARTDRDRLAARLELADVQNLRGDPRRSVATLQDLLADERLRILNVDAADGHRTVRADLLIADRLNSLIREKGADLYASFDRTAVVLFERGKAEEDPRLLEDVARCYPAARVVPEAWFALGQLYEKLRRPGDSARAFKHLLAGGVDDATRVRALFGLARAYETQKLWVLARDAYLQAKGRYADARFADLGPGRVADLVDARLAAEPFRRVVADRAEPTVPLPLRRRWDRHWSEPTRPIAAAGVPPSGESGRIFLVQGRSIRPVDPATGESPWARDLEGEPIWVGYLADRIIAATRSRVVGLSLDQGAVDWQYDLARAAADPAAANPFDRPAPAEGPDPGSATLSDFRIVGNRVFCLRGRDALLAFDGDSGLLDWSYAPASGSINPRLHVGPRRIVLQVRKPNAILVLDTATGRRRAEFPQAEDEDWPRDPLPIDDDHAAIVVDRLTVALFDLNRGVNTWIFREASDQPKFNAPRLFGDAERLLVLHDGAELIRLDPATGAKRWSRLLGTEDLSERPEAIALGEDRVFVANGPTLAALSLLDGGPAWRFSLDGPPAGWRLALTERSVAAYPGPPPRDQVLGSLPLILLRRDDGQPIQRLFFQTTVSDLIIRFGTRGALVATQGGLWALGDRQVMDGSKAPR